MAGKIPQQRKDKSIEVQLADLGPLQQSFLNFALELLFPAGCVAGTFHTPLERLSVQLWPLDCELPEGKACVVVTAVSPGTVLAPRIQR